MTLKKYKNIRISIIPKAKSSLIEIPPMRFVMVNGKGDLNTSEEYAAAMEILYGISFTIKMSKMAGDTPIGYFDYVVLPLEGLWWVESEYFNGVNITDKYKFLWTSMIRQTDFVTDKVFQDAKEKLREKCLILISTKPV